MSKSANPLTSHFYPLAWRVQNALQPREGWLSLVLLISGVLIVTQNISDSRWVAFDLKLQSSAVVAIFLTTLVAKQPIKAWRAWLLLIGYGGVLIPIRLGGWWPTISVWFDGVEAAQAFSRPQYALFAERLSDWADSLRLGEPTQEVLPFALLVALLVWICTVYLTWATYRNAQPLPALTLMGGALALNSYFGGDTDTSSIISFLAIAFALVALVRWRALEHMWDRQQVDYSDELQHEFAAVVLLLAVALPLVSFWLPPLSLSQVAGRFAESAAVVRVEGWLEQAFGGVNTNVGGEGGRSADNDQSSRRTGVMPRNYLLGDAPDLYETIVMTASVQSDVRVLTRATHWRALSFDVYSGAGWWRSDTREIATAADFELPLTEVSATASVAQDVHWLADDRLIRYSYGLPERFLQPVDAFWASDEDLIYAHGVEDTYQLESRVSVASAEMLNSAQLADVPPLILGTYRQLPDSVPQRVHDLAAEITASATTPYEQARALEAFVRQYEYSLDVSAPPPDQDVADFFLFDQQAGYCDYFATSMTVLARSVGLPARMAIGFNAQTPDANGVQTIYEINGHSWTEIYFAGYGWIEFEPTATFVISAEIDPTNTLDETTPEISPVVPIPTATMTRPTLSTFLFWGGALLLVAWLVWALRPAPTLTQRYTQLQQLAARLPTGINVGQTPFEFEAQLSAYITQAVREHRFLKGSAWESRQQVTLQLIRQTVSEYAARVYGEGNSAETPITKQAWRQSYWLLTLLRWLP
ncbi:MAG: transglutaminase-like domain-containing protein [Candidatus Promineifilaceae bacterium]